MVPLSLGSTVDKLFSLEIRTMAKDGVLSVDTSQAGGMSLARMLCQLSIPKALEVRQVQQEDNLLVFLKEGRNLQH